MFDLLFELGFMPRGHCGPWHEGYKLLYIMSGFSIWAAYLGIPCILFQAIRHRKKHNIEPKELTDSEWVQFVVAYMFFIGFCGQGHLLEIGAFVWPAYHFFAVWHALTAAASWWALFVTFRFRAKRLIGV